jgi:C-terminal processing protease CtpA/Prc
MYAIIPSLAPADQAGEMTPLPVSPDRFTGSIVVLSGPRNASGSTMLISKLQDAGRATIVGQPTGGSAEGPTAGFILFLKLPNSGIVVRVPDMWNKMAVTHFRHGYGVEPDVRVEPTLDDFLLDRDAVLQAAQRR